MKVLFDPRIQGYFSSKDKQGKQQIVDDIVSLAKEFKRLKLTMNGFYKYLDKVIEPLAKKSTCGSFSDCSMCCHQNVKLSRAEFNYMATKEIKKLTVKVMDAEERKKQRVPCVLLKDGKCSVYERRPIACRIFQVDSSPSKCSDFNGDVISSPQIMITSSAWRTYERQESLKLLEQHIEGK